MRLGLFIHHGIRPRPIGPLLRFAERLQLHSWTPTPAGHFWHRLTFPTIHEPSTHSSYSEKLDERRKAKKGRAPGAGDLQMRIARTASGANKALLGSDQQTATWRVCGAPLACSAPAAGPPSRSAASGPRAPHQPQGI